MKMTVKALREHVRIALMETTFETQDVEGLNIKAITKETLAQIAPAAVAAVEEPEDLEMIWVVTEKPVQLRAGTEEEYFTDEEWSGTNEPELAQWLSEDWDQLAVNVGGQQVVILCGSYDDEYGNIWNASTGKWQSYAF